MAAFLPRSVTLTIDSGLTNPEVGARLFLSARTVEWHLRKIYTKLSISSRRELRGVPPRQAGA
jgi:ATP/maltotriose-dependent transcriptional regulator MalT